MSARSGIVKAFVAAIKEELNGQAPYVSNIYKNATNNTTHFDSINNFPFISITPGSETREALPSLQTWGYLTVYFRIYVSNEDDAQGELESLISDLEIFIDKYRRLSYNVITHSGINNLEITDSEITSISTDEGLLAPKAVGEVAVLVRYEKNRQYF